MALALASALVEVWCLARERPGLRLWAAAGVLAGLALLALLARADTVLLIVLLGVLELTSRRLRTLLPTAGTALAAVLPGWACS